MTMGDKPVWELVSPTSPPREELPPPKAAPNPEKAPPIEFKSWAITENPFWTVRGRFARNLPMFAKASVKEETPAKTLVKSVATAFSKPARVFSKEAMSFSRGSRILWTSWFARQDEYSAHFAGFSASSPVGMAQPPEWEEVTEERFVGPVALEAGAPNRGILLPP